MFVHITPRRPSFVQQDLDTLYKHYEVKEVVYRSRRDIGKIMSGTLWADITLSWFAWDHASWTTRFSRLFHRKSILIVGGFDVVRMPEISYGNLLHPQSAVRTLYALRHADRVTAISNSLKTDASHFSGRQDINLIYLGFDSERFKPNHNKEPVAITVGTVNRSNFKRKGIETFIKTAPLVPEINFRLIGEIDSRLHHEITKTASDNLSVVGRVDFETLLKEMQNASVYVQVSAHEGFGCSLAEAMLCKAIPVVTNAGAIPEVVGDCGYYVPFDDPVSTAKAIRKALEDKKRGEMARRRITNEFPLAMREEKLTGLISDVMR